jgi:predicted glycosyltransferase
MTKEFPRVDILLYCHDGRGMGHVSRTVALALAIQRLAPTLRTIILTGSEWVPTLVGSDRVDWVKLPSYRAEFRNGSAIGTPGPLGYSHTDLAALRGFLIADIIRRLRPRAVVVDHYADGKNGELEQALRSMRQTDTQWILGLRAVVGDASRIWSSRTRALVAAHYRAILWYGDTAITGPEERDRITAAFEGVPLRETGYVSRAAELSRIDAIPFPVTMACGNDAVAAFTWCSSESVAILRSLARLLDPPLFRQWHVSLGPILDSAARKDSPVELLRSRGAVVSKPGLTFLASLQCAKVALLHAGYNSLTDIVWARKPAVVIVRDTADREQSTHVARLGATMPNVTFLDERDASIPAHLQRALERSAHVDARVQPSMSIEGAATAAAKVLGVIKHTYAAASTSGR